MCVHMHTCICVRVSALQVVAKHGNVDMVIITPPFFKRRLNNKGPLNKRGFHFYFGVSVFHSFIFFSFPFFSFLFLSFHFFSFTSPLAFLYFSFLFLCFCFTLLYFSFTFLYFSFTFLYFPILFFSFAFPLLLLCFCFTFPLVVGSFFKRL